MTLKQFEKKFFNIKNQGWIENMFKKNKNGGAGNTLESLLGVSENNLKTPDLGKIELKTTKKTSSGTITLFTYDRGIWLIKQKDVLQKYGRWIEDKRRYDLYFIHNIEKPTSDGITTQINGNNLELIAPDGVKIMKYPFSKMADRWNEKLKQSIIVNFKERKNENGYREYKYNSFKYHIGEMSQEIMKKAWEEGILIMETSMHSKPNGTPRNHGTKIRAKQVDIDKIYEMSKK